MSSESMTTFETDPETASLALDINEGRLHPLPRIYGQDGSTKTPLDSIKNDEINESEAELNLIENKSSGTITMIKPEFRRFEIAVETEKWSIERELAAEKLIEDSDSKTVKPGNQQSLDKRSELLRDYRENFQPRMRDTLLEYERQRYRDVVDNWNTILEGQEQLEFESELDESVEGELGEEILEAELGDLTSGFDESDSLAKNLMELEYFVDNPEEVLQDESVSKNSMASRAEYVLAELDETEIEALLPEIEGDEVEFGEYSPESFVEGPAEFTSTWVDPYGNVMGYDAVEGKNKGILHSSTMENIRKRKESDENPISDARKAYKGEEFSEEEYIQDAIEAAANDPEKREEFVKKYIPANLESIESLGTMEKANRLLFETLYDEIESYREKLTYKSDIVDEMASRRDKIEDTILG